MPWWIGASGAPPASRPGDSGRLIIHPSVEELVMKWETPLAVDFRFGMEITMYIAHR